MATSPAKLDIIEHRFGVFCAINKPADVRIDGPHPMTVSKLLQEGLPAPKLHLVHQLDYATSGVMIWGLEKAAAAALSKAFRERKVRKVYLAIVHDHLPDTLKTLDWGIFEGTDFRQATSSPIAPGRPALTRVQVLRRGFLDGNPASYVMLFPVTGRRHQLRLHLALAGYPIWGDQSYGGTRDRHERMMLHAHHLALRCAFPAHLSAQVADSGSKSQGAGQKLSIRSSMAVEESLRFTTPSPFGSLVETWEPTTFFSQYNCQEITVLEDLSLASPYSEDIAECCIIPFAQRSQQDGAGKERVFLLGTSPDRKWRLDKKIKGNQKFIGRDAVEGDGIGHLYSARGWRWNGFLNPRGDADPDYAVSAAHGLCSQLSYHAVMKLFGLTADLQNQLPRSKPLPALSYLPSPDTPPLTTERQATGTSSLSSSSSSSSSSLPMSSVRSLSAPSLQWTSLAKWKQFLWAMYRLFCSWLRYFFSRFSFSDLSGSPNVPRTEKIPSQKAEAKSDLDQKAGDDKEKEGREEDHYVQELARLLRRGGLAQRVTLRQIYSPLPTRSTSTLPPSSASNESKADCVLVMTPVRYHSDSDLQLTLDAHRSPSCRTKEVRWHTMSELVKDGHFGWLIPHINRLDDSAPSS